MNITKPSEWATEVASTLNCKADLNSIATALNKDGISANTVKDYLTAYTGIVIKKLDRKKVLDLVKGSRKGYTPSPVNSGLKEKGVSEELLIPGGRRGRGSGDVVLDDGDMLDLFGSIEDSEDSEEVQDN